MAADVPLSQPIVLTPPVKKSQRAEGDTFNFVKFAVDDFTATSYFDGLSGKGVRVAVLDTGCDKHHPALAGRIDVANSKNYTDNNRGDPLDFSDGNGHGTHCAGIIAAEKRDAIMYGIAPEATICAMKVLSNGGEVRLGAVPLRIAEAIRDAVKAGCKVISMSLGLPEILMKPYVEDMGEVYKACQEAMAAGVTICAAAGNLGRSRSNTIEPPGAYGGVITVASHDDSGVRSRFSSMGGELDVMAPGEVFSTWPLDLPFRRGGFSRRPNLYEPLEGTSMATPLVAGIAALLIEAGQRPLNSLSEPLARDLDETGFRARNNYEVRELIRLLAERPNEHRREDGYGRLVRAYEYVSGKVPAIEVAESVLGSSTAAKA